MTSTLSPLVQAFSGGVASAAANAISYPLDLIATRMRTADRRKVKGLRGIYLIIQHIRHTEGWQGLYDGLVPDTLANFLSSFLYFYFYTFIRALIVRQKGRQVLPSGRTTSRATLLLSPPEEIGLGFLAGVASRAVTTPLNLITVRLQTANDDVDDEVSDEKTRENDRPKALRTIDVVKHIYKEEGLQGFWRGFTTAIPLSLQPSLTMFLFQNFRRLLNVHSPHKTKLASPSPREAFIGGAFSNSIAITFLYPLLLAKTRLQMEHHRAQESGSEDETERSTLAIWRKTYERDGLAGLYQGLEAQILKGFVNQGLAMMVKSRIELIVVALYLGYLRHQRAKHGGSPA